MSNISVASYSLRNLLKDPSFGFKGIADFLEKQEIKYVELNNIFLKPETFSETVKIFTDKGITPIMITVDGNNFFQKNEKGGKKQFEFMKTWLDLAKSADIPFVRANMGRNLGFLKKTDTIENFVACFTPILEYAEKLGIKFVFENHGGKSSDVNFQIKVKEKFPSPYMGYLLDTGNYNPKDLVYENILKLKDSILMIHAKTYSFDENGDDTKLDFKKIIENLKKVGYDGYYSIEFEGEGPDIEGVEKTIALLRKYL
jgi:sugar phosphate isomerase/epimerase